MRKNARLLHDAFRSTHGATCCRVLSRGVRHDRQAHFQQCAHLTAVAAEMAAQMIFYHRPELVQCSENEFLRNMDTKFSAMMTRLLQLLCLKT